MQDLENFLKNKNYDGAINHCTLTKQFRLGETLSAILKKAKPLYHQIQIAPEPIPQAISSSLQTPLITVKLLCNWTDSASLKSLWDKMSQGNGRWGRIQTVTDDNPHYFVIINAPLPTDKFDKKRTIVFQMEPNMDKTEHWGEWKNPNPKEFLKVFTHKTDYNNNEWHLSQTYNELICSSPVKNKGNIISTVLTNKYRDPGHIRRVDFVKFLEKKGITVDVFGENKFEYLNYKGGLPYHKKDDGIFPYKYTFNVENHSICNYYTEKLIDGILGECLTFYSGCYNVREYIDSRAYVYLELSDFNKAYNTVRNAIENNLWEERLPYIREAKKKILNELQFFPRLEKFLTSLE